MASSIKPEDSGIGSATIGVGAMVIGLAVIFVALRIWTRIFTRLGLWWDDWLIVASVFMTLVTAALLLVGNEIDPHGAWVSTAADPKYVYTSDDTLYMKLSWVCSMLYFTISGSTKLGILLMYIRIFYISPGFRAQVIGVSTLVVAYWISATIATLLTCRPMYYLWSTNSGYPQYCFNYNVFWLVMGIVELLLDVMILVLPIRVVMDVKLSRRKKLSVTGIFMLGGFVIVTGIVKIVLAYNPGGHSPLYGAAEVWVTLHAGMAIVCACLPILKPVLTRFTKSVSSTSSSGTPHHSLVKRERGAVKSGGSDSLDGTTVVQSSVSKSQVETDIRECLVDDLEKSARTS